jgi:hypothetical protein
MYTKDFLVDNGTNWHTIEAVREGFPQSNVVPPLAFIVEPIDSVDTGTLVVPTENEKVFGILNLVCEEETNSLKRLLPTVNVVPKEEIVAFWRELAIFKQPKQVVVLPVDVTTDLDWCLKFEEDGLRHEHLSS